MRRALAVACAVAAFATPSQARAETVIAGSVAAPAPTGPSAARHLYLFSDKLDGVAGDVIEIEPSGNKRAFELRSLGGATGQEDLDVRFYLSLEGTGTPCEREITAELEAGGEAGFICPNARWAVVTLFEGADARFQLQY